MKDMVAVVAAPKEECCSEGCRGIADPVRGGVATRGAQLRVIGTGGAWLLRRGLVAVWRC